MLLRSSVRARQSSCRWPPEKFRPPSLTEYLLRAIYTSIFTYKFHIQISHLYYMEQVLEREIAEPHAFQSGEHVRLLLHTERIHVCPHSAREQHRVLRDRRVRERERQSERERGRGRRRQRDRGREIDANPDRQLDRETDPERQRQRQT